MWPIVLLLALSSCKTQTLFPDFKIGMSEDEWKSKEQKFGVQGPILYSWKLGASVIETHISLNGDGINYGPLRLISVNLATKTVIGNESNNYMSAICPSTKLDSVLLYLEKKLGKPDSVTFKTHSLINAIDYLDVAGYLLWRKGDKATLAKVDSLDRVAGTDTTAYRYYFHNNGSTILVIRSKMTSATVNLPYGYYESAAIYQVSASYEKELSSIIQSREKALKPRDIVVIPIYTKVATEKTLYGTQERRLYLTAIVDELNGHFVAIEENKAILSIKGRIVIKDNHKDSILCYPDFKMDLKQPLQRAYSPGLRFAMGEYGGMSIEEFTGTRREVFARIDNPSMPLELRSAFENGEGISAVFIPESLLFSNGTVLKQ